MQFLSVAIIKMKKWFLRCFLKWKQENLITSPAGNLYQLKVIRNKNYSQTTLLKNTIVVTE